MKTLQLTLLLSVLIYFGACTEKKETDTDQQDKKDQKLGEDSGDFEVPEGFYSIVVADTLGDPRHIDVNSNGDLYVNIGDPDDNEPGVLAMRDTDGDGVMDETHGIGEHFGGTGLELFDDYLYASSNTTVFRYKLDKAGWLPSGKGEVVIANYPDQSQHESKSLTFDNEGNIYVNIGAPSNACMEQSRTKGSPGMDPCPLLEKHAGIWQYSGSELNQDAYEDGYHYATGIRNTVALEWNDVDDELYALQHGRDQLSQFFPDLYTAEENADLPSEEFLRVLKDSDFGWPYCYYDQLQEKKVLNPEYGGDGEKVGRCADKDMPEIGFPGHIAPNDLLFYSGDMFPEKYNNGAFIAFHGSWNRAPEDQYGFFVVFVPFENGRATGDWEVFAEGFHGDEPVESPAHAKYRPTGLAQGPDGSLYVSDDKGGRIWRILYQPTE